MVEISGGYEIMVYLDDQEIVALTRVTNDEIERETVKVGSRKDRGEYFR